MVIFTTLFHATLIEIDVKQGGLFSTYSLKAYLTVALFAVFDAAP